MKGGLGAPLTERRVIRPENRRRKSLPVLFYGKERYDLLK
jgi:hypothetical protein